MKHLLCCAIVLGLVAPAPMSAHHSFQAEYDQTKPLTLVGKITKVVQENPHGWIYMDAKNDKGKIVNWALELPAPNVVIRNGFDFEYYLLKNPDVGAAGVDPLVHFQTFGFKEGRDPNAWFDTKGYLAAYTDVAAAGINPLTHYMVSGAHEGRDPSAAFDTSDYLAANPDVAAAGVNPLQHFLQFGIHEGRSPFSDGLFS